MRPGQRKRHAMTRRERKDAAKRQLRRRLWQDEFVRITRRFDGLVSPTRWVSLAELESIYPPAINEENGC